MRSANASTSIAPWLALAVGVVNLLGTLFLFLMFILMLTSVSNGDPFGPLNDFSNGLGAALSAALAAALHGWLRARGPRIALPATILALVGALIGIYGSWLIMSGTTGFVLAGLVSMAGYALIGLSLLALNHGSSWPRGLVKLGIATGAVMALGLAAIPSVLMRIDSLEAAVWHTWIGQAGWFGWGVLLPVWALRLWKALRSAA
jgi:hypothetical protein